MLEGFRSELGRLKVKTRAGVVKHVRRHWRKDLLLNLLNLEGTDCAPFWRSTLAPPKVEPDEGLLQLRDELREIFSRDAKDNYIQETLNRWLHWKPPVGSESFPSFILNWPRLDDNPSNLRVSLVKAVTEVFGKIGRCENPDCRVYFIKLKTKYRFCDNHNCQVYGQRKYKREWWAEHGSARRAKKKSVKAHLPASTRARQRSA
jgi:hypothetical protein